ncbi:hypothetical protein [Methylobacter tundripaludum]
MSGALSKIESAGFNVSLVGGNLAVSPASNLTQLQKEFLRSHKAEIIQELAAVTLLETDRQKILSYLDSINETDQALINDLLERCRTDREALAWVLNWADKVRGKLPAPPVSVTCRSCANFNSYNAHGGGAGQCDAGVRSSGYCRWADDRHQCGEYQSKM